MVQVEPLGYHQYLVAIRTSPQATASTIAGPLAVQRGAGSRRRPPRRPDRACEAPFLEHAGAHTTDLVISLLAKRRFDVPRVAARVNDEENTWLFDHRWGVDVAVPATGPVGRGGKFTWGLH